MICDCIGVIVYQLLNLYDKLTKLQLYITKFITKVKIFVDNYHT